MLTRRNTFLFLWCGRSTSQSFCVSLLGYDLVSWRRLLDLQIFFLNGQAWRVLKRGVLCPIHLMYFACHSRSLFRCKTSSWIDPPYHSNYFFLFVPFFFLFCLSSSQVWYNLFLKVEFILRGVYFSTCARIYLCECMCFAREKSAVANPSAQRQLKQKLIIKKKEKKLAEIGKWVDSSRVWSAQGGKRRVFSICIPMISVLIILFQWFIQ